MKRMVLGVVAASLLMTLVLLARGCGYGDITPTAYKYAGAVYSVCNRRDETRLGEVRRQIIAAADAGELSSRELGWLTAILDEAQSGAWGDATKRARRLMMDQVEDR